jgi:regulator of sirC expression with transglutaminase-like and TPR domain
MPVALLLAQARLAALEDFRAFASELNSAPLLGGGGFDLPRALAHIARFANPSYEPEEAADLVASLARTVSQRCEAMAAAQRERDADAEAAHPENVPSPEARASEDAARRLLALVSVMEEAGFTINHADPFDPANTYIDALLDRRLGEGGL